MKQIFSFKGRYTRKQFWITQLSVAAVNVITMLIAFQLSDYSITNFEGTDFEILLLLMILPAHYVAWAAGAKRCRDFGMSAYFVLTVLIPVVGTFTYLYIGCKRSIGRPKIETMV